MTPFILFNRLPHLYSQHAIAIHFVHTYDTASTSRLAFAHHDYSGVSLLCIKGFHHTK